jgi:hypothetical protein
LSNGHEDPEFLYTCLKKDFYYILLFLKVSQCKFKQKEAILKLLKSESKFTKSKIDWGASTSTPYQGFTLKPLGASDSRSNFLSV